MSILINPCIINDRKIAILLSTFNGMRYVPELIRSILSQSCQDFTLYIRDDGSKDNTLTILKSFAESSDRVVIIDSESKI